MPRPEFTSEEQYLISYLQQPRASSWHPNTVGQLVVGLMIGGIAIYNANLAIAICGIVFLLGYRIYEELYQQRYNVIWRSIVDKYEAAIKLADNNNSHG